MGNNGIKEMSPRKTIRQMMKKEGPEMLDLILSIEKTAHDEMEWRNRLLALCDINCTAG